VNKLPLLKFNLLLAVLLTVVIGGCESAPPVVQPIRFNHQAHTSKGLSCVFCHRYVKTASFAGIPDITVCATCHRGAITRNPEGEKVRQHVLQRENIAWRRIYQVPSYVYFSHRRHVTLGGIECASCHGSIKDSTSPQTRPAVVFTMDRCVTCHDQHKANTDCYACHH
jgi:hypothetical protein